MFELDVEVGRDSLFPQNKSTVPLPEKEQRELAQLVIKGDKEAREKLLKTSLPLVTFHINKLKHTFKAPRADLFQAGCIGLCLAVDRYDPSRKASFAHYASFWIRAYAIREGNTHRGITKMPNGSDFRKALHNSRRSYKKLSKGGNKPTYEDIAVDIGIGKDKAELVEIALKGLDNYVSIDSPLGGKLEGEELTLGAALPSEDPPVSDVLEAKELLEILDEFRRTQLKDRDLYIWVNRTGALPGQKLTLEEIGKELGVTKERVRQIENEVKHRFLEWTLNEYNVDLFHTSWAPKKLRKKVN